MDVVEDKKTMARDADMAYNAQRARSNTCPIRLERLKKAYKQANDDLNDAINAASCSANPYPSVDPSSKEYYVDPFEESPPPGPIDEGSEVGDNPLDF